ncbi:autotransporter-associated beta strand repeat-containing protein [Saccharothrix deserti]|uniref:autotransporter-associated beta strand repeat-containing protein n=1 Tax=Saccharothrix deserti TaxID=2593674 RepID=UPI001EE3FB59|nr:autotransporter-associated beta strand repeat-containing protein [Saccharothrix deserti]
MIRATAVMAVVVAMVVPPAASAQPAGRDVTADIKANRNVVLTGDAVVRLTGDATTYTGVISGEGTFTVEGTGTLVLVKNSDFTLPADRRRQKIVTVGGNHPVTTIENPDPPGVVVRRGATLQYGSGTGGDGVIGHFTQAPEVLINNLNHQVDGTLDVAVHRLVNLGIISGSGLVKQRRSTWPGIDLPGAHPFSGTLYVGTGAGYGSLHFLTSTPNLRKVLNQGSFIHHAADKQVTVDAADVYSQKWGGDINFHTWGSGVVRMSGVYSWSDNGSDTDPALSDPSRNFAVVPHNDNKRGINIEGATVQWGDGTHNRFFLPGNEKTVYINMHAERNGTRSKLTLDYNGPVTLDAPISGGIYHDTLKDVGRGDVVIAATPGNAVTFTAPQNYDGSTTIGAGASLRLGDGTPQGDSSLLQVGGGGAVVVDGELILQNAAQGVRLSGVGGRGSLTQVGPAAATLAGGVTYQGKTTVKGGTLAVTGGTLSASSAVELAAPGATLDLAKAGDQTINNLGGSEGSTVLVGTALTLNAAAATTFGGAIAASEETSVVKTGPETLVLTGASTTPKGLWTVREGVVELAASAPSAGSAASVASAASVQARQVTVEPGGALKAGGTVEGAVENFGTVTADGLTVRGSYAQRSGAKFVAGRMTVSGPVSLAGTFELRPGGAAGVVIDNTGADAVTGTFDGLPEGAEIGGHRISYRGGDGNDVELTDKSAAAAELDQGVGGSQALVTPTSGNVLLWSLAGGGVSVLLGAALLFLLRRRRRRR